MFKDAFERANSFDRDKVRDALATDMDAFMVRSGFQRRQRTSQRCFFAKFRQMAATKIYLTKTRPRKVRILRLNSGRNILTVGTPSFRTFGTDPRTDLTIALSLGCL